MREAAIVSAARTPIGRAFRGAYNQTPGATMAGHAVKHAIERASIAPHDVQDVIIGCGLPEGATGNNVGRTAAMRAGCPVTVPGQTVSRFCASGLDAIAAAAKRVIADGANVVVAGGVESISMVQNDLNLHFFAEEWLLRHQPDLYTPMLYTADFVAKKYTISRERQDEYALQSQQRTAAAQAAGRFDAEIVPMASWKYVQEKESGAVREERVELGKDEGNRPDTTLAGLASLKGAVTGVADATITAGNSSQLSDGAAAVVVMETRGGEAAWIAAARILSRLRRCRLRAGGDGDRSRVRRSDAARSARALGRRYRALGTQRSLRGADGLLPRYARPSERSLQRRRRRHLDRASVRHERGADDDARAH